MQYVIIVAGGDGKRMKSDIPKQYIEINSVPVIIRTLRCFLNYDPGMRVILCVHPSYKEHVESLLKKHVPDGSDIQITHGGETRFHSVKNGLMLVDDPNAVVGIHDAARPFVSAETIRYCYDTAASKGNAVPCLPVNESLRKISNNINNSVNRNEYKLVQTPQCFQVNLIKKAYEQDYQVTFTDDASVFETLGERIQLVEGNPQNIKITSPFDLVIARAIAQSLEQ
ncbi:MAG TPA: 2-C-methyl-D-erythritol 4-phosphate cytidylyltransferase [Bacteroidia bacterium]|nr:2-C-methyl-D-erythritol 4-phosphate cytidylyltransferase [Bacteroidia bacterium]